VTTLADRTIDAIHRTHDRLTVLVRGLAMEDLARPSGAQEWTVAQVLSHLGSGAELTLTTLRTAQGGEQRAGDDNQEVWARWDAMAPREQADNFVLADSRLVDALVALDGPTRDSLSVTLDFLPEPIDLALVVGLRLSETALHAWDVEVGFDHLAVLPSDVAAILIEQYRGPLDFLLGFGGRTDELGGRTADLAVYCSAPDVALGLLIGERAQLGEVPAAPDGELRLPAEALLRLLAGRLTESRTPDGVEVTGALTLDDLRRVFPGY
jgi:uncharacterized protein (TIGR03083 family)